MKIRHIVFSLLPALAMAETATTVPDDEPLLPPLPEELLSPQKGAEGLPATARPVVSYRAPADEEQTWLKLFYVKDTEEWPAIFRRMAAASHEKDMQMCHGYTLWLKGHELIHLRYDDDLSLSGIHADGHAYGVLYVEFSPYGIRVSPMEGYDLNGKNGGVCWQNGASKLWSWADSGQFWGELPKLLRADKGTTKATSAQDSAVKREVATKGQRMVVFWATAGYPAKAWWAAFSSLHAAVGPQRFSLIAPDGLKLWNDVEVPVVTPATGLAKPTNAVPTAPVPAEGAVPKAPAASVPAPAVPAVQPSPPAENNPAPSAPQQGTPAPVAPAPAAEAHPIPDTLRPAAGTPGDVAPAASVRPWAIEGNAAPVPTSPGRKKKTTAPAAQPAGTPATPGSTSAAGGPPEEGGQAAAAAPVAAVVPPAVTQPVSVAVVSAVAAGEAPLPAAPAAAPVAAAPAPVTQAEPPQPVAAPAEPTPASSVRNLENVGGIGLP